MKTKLYIGNLSYDTTEDSLRAFFSRGGRHVASASIVTDRVTGQSRGFGFVEMGSSEEAEAVVKELDAQELDGRKIRVNEARDRDPGAGFRGARERRPYGGRGFSDSGNEG